MANQVAGWWTSAAANAIRRQQRTVIAEVTKQGTIKKQKRKTSRSPRQKGGKSR
jgi:hypothetical protein